jgi:hypothetical protein
LKSRVAYFGQYQNLWKGRDLRNGSCVEDGKAPKTTPSGSGHPEK